MNNILQYIRQLEARIVELEKKQVSRLRLDGIVNNEVSAPATPLSGTTILYAKSDGKLYYKDDAGQERLLSYTT